MAEYILSLLNLFEAEGELLKVNIFRTVRGCGYILIALLFLVGACAFFLVAIYDSLILFLPRIAVLGISGFICCLFALLFLWRAKTCATQRKSQ